jgi:uncharacterized membrane protein YhaH (DUF805 family)
MAFCSNCGTQLDEGAKFCANCGTVLGAAPGGTALGQTANSYAAPPVQPAAPPQFNPYAPPRAACQNTVQPAPNPFECFGMAWTNYAVFSGRTRRAEFWWFYLFNLLIGFVLLIIDGQAGFMITQNIGVLSGLYYLTALVPGLALGWRRMHDVDKAGPYYLIPFYDLVLAATAGTQGPNRFGADPKQA